MIIYCRSVSNNGDQLHNNQDVGENLINSYPSKNLATGLFDHPACDYLKKMDNGWDSTFNNFNDDIFEPQSRLTKLSSNLVSNWSIAPPDPQVNHHFNPHNNMSLTPTLDQYTSPSHDVCYMKPSVNYRTFKSYSSSHDDHDLKLNNEQRVFTANGIGYDQEMNNCLVGDNYEAMQDVPCNINNGRNFADVLTFSNCFSNKPPINVHGSKSITLKSLNLSDCVSSLNFAYILL